MIGRIAGMRQRWIERRAYRWVMLMLDDPTRYAASLERWLAKAPEHRAVYRRVAVEVGYASDAAARMPSLRFDAVGQEQAPQRGRTRHLLAPLGIAATAAILAGLGWQVLSSQWLGGDDQRMEPRTIAIATRSQSTRLADGSILTLLGAGSAFVRYTRDERAIDLKQGRARFAVEHDPSRPFIVYVEGGKVTAVGTVFEVETGQRVRVKLISGRVIVTRPTALPSSRENKVILTKGQQLTFDPAPVDRPPAAAPPASTRPRDIRTFDDVRVSRIVQEVNRRSSIQLILTDPTIGEEKVFADLNVSDPDGVASKLALLLNLRVDRSRPGQLRLSRNH